MNGASPSMRSGTCVLWLAALAFDATAAARVEITAPPDSDRFGADVTVLPGGNVVVVDFLYGPTNVGAVHLYRPEPGYQPGDDHRVAER